MAELKRAKTVAAAARMTAFHLAGEQCDLRAVVRSDIALVTFDNLASIDERPATGPWVPWLWAHAERLGFSLVGVQSHAKDWYRNPEAARHITGLEARGFFKQFREVLFVGASMGGFAAVCFAGLVPGARVLAFSPQSSLNRQVAPFERRYPWPYKRFDWESPGFLDAADYLALVPGGHILFDPHVTEDQLHAERLTTDKVRPVKLPFSEHTSVRTVAKAGALDHLLRVVAEKGEIDTTFWRLMRNRRNDKPWAKQLVRDLEARGDGPLLRQACAFLRQHYGYPFARRVPRRLDAAAEAEAAAVATRKADAPFWADDLSEAALRQRFPVFINSFNQFTYLRDTVDWFARHGFENVTVLDNASTYPRLLEYLKSDRFKAKARLVLLGENLGPRRALARAAENRGTDGGFIFTDPDLELPARPDGQMLKTMIEMGLRHDYVKVGLALSLDPARIDLDRVTYKTRTVEQVERKYWKNEVEPGVSVATTDTTFFVYVPRARDGKRFNDYGLKQAKIPAIRVGRKGFVAVHRPWLHQDDVPAEETRYYHEITQGHSTYVMAQKAAGA